MKMYLRMSYYGSGTVLRGEKYNGEETHPLGTCQLL